MHQLVGLIGALSLTSTTSSESKKPFELELELYHTGEALKPGIKTHAVFYNFDEKFGLFVHTFIMDSLAEGYVGLSYRANHWLNLEVGLGVEQAQIPYRIGGSILLKTGDKISLLTYIEMGGSGPWYQSIFNWRVCDWSALSWILRRFAGTGPRIELIIPHTPLSAGLALPFWEVESGLIKPHLLVSIQLSFGVRSEKTPQEEEEEKWLEISNRFP